MNIDTQKIVELTGFIAVVVSLLFVAFELRQSNRIAIGNAELAMSALNADVNRVIFELEENDEVFVKLTTKDSDLTPEEYQRAIYIAYMHLNRWVATERSFENGLLSETTFLTEFDDVTFLFQRMPGFAPIFVYLIESYPITENGFSELITHAREEASKALE